MVLEKTLESPLYARRSNQSVLREINPEYSLEGLLLKLKFQFFGHLMWWADSLEKTLMLERIEAKGERGGKGWDGWMASPTSWTWVWACFGNWLWQMWSEKRVNKWLLKILEKFSIVCFCFHLIYRKLSLFPYTIKITLLWVEERLSFPWGNHVNLLKRLISFSGNRNKNSLLSFHFCSLKYLCCTRINYPFALERCLPQLITTFSVTNISSIKDKFHVLITRCT